MKKFILIVTFILLLVLASFIYFRFFFVFGEGVKNGQLNYVVYKGYIFKTYEGKLIQQGFRSEGSGKMGSNEFEFSVSGKEVAERLMREGGEEVELHYKEYKHALPWRGYSAYVVDSIVSISKKPRQEEEDTPPPPPAPSLLEL
ncbi:MAG: hypothetical protein LBT94_04790 [Prevotellaceae bacterium]|jgi:hypothetical protein|nr:hypothetical protein [Prevotellaceae bacterium]